MSIQTNLQKRNWFPRRVWFHVSWHRVLPHVTFLPLSLVFACAFHVQAASKPPTLPLPGGTPGSVQYCTNLGNNLSELQKAYTSLPPGEQSDDQTQENYNAAAAMWKYDWYAHGCGGLVKISGCTDQNLCPPDSLPTSSGTTANLGGAVNIPFSAFDLASPPRPPLPTKPFTTNEIVAVAPAGRIVTNGLGQFVKTQKGPLLPLTTYVSQLNDMETFLNQYGYTLRDGPLSGRSMGASSTSDLGLQFKLRSLQPLPNALIKRTVGTTPFPPHLPTLTYDPLKQPEYINFPTTNLGPMVTQQPNAIDVTGYTFAPRVVQLAKGIVPSDPPHPAPDSKVPRDLQCPIGGAASCGLTYGNNVTLTDIGISIADGCTIDGPCRPVWVDSILMTFFVDDQNRDQVNFFLQNYTNPCAVLNKLGSQFASMVYILPVEYMSGSGHGVASTQGTTASSFFDGVLEVETDGWHPCKYLNGGMSDWFGGSFCVTYDSNNQYHPHDGQPNQGFDISESMGVGAYASIFGQGFTLLEGSSSIEWKDAEGPNPVNTQAITDPWTQTSLNPSNNMETFDGPRAYFTIGPIPVSVKSFLTASLDVGDPTYKFTAPPVNKNQGGPAGDIGVGVSAEASAVVTITAGIDVGIASAGVYGALTLFDHKLDGGIESTLDTSTNSLLIKQNTDWTLNSMNGELGLYVEVDLLVYSKRWEVELAHFDGYTETVPVTNYTAGPYQAKIPATATQSCP